MYMVTIPGADVLSGFWTCFVTMNRRLLLPHVRLLVIVFHWLLGF